jgi:hypothetical protein
MSITGFEIFAVNERTLVTQEEQPILGGYLADFIANMA